MRKEYLKPKVESESSIEQTSLACTVTQDWQTEGAFFADSWCGIDATKGGNFGGGLCAINLLGEDETCDPIFVGVPLS